MRKYLAVFEALEMGEKVIMFGDTYVMIEINCVPTLAREVDAVKGYEEKKYE